MDNQKIVSYKVQSEKVPGALTTQLPGVGGVLIISLGGRRGGVGARERLGGGWQEGLADTGRNSSIKRRCFYTQIFLMPKSEEPLSMYSKHPMVIPNANKRYAWKTSAFHLV